MTRILQNQKPYVKQIATYVSLLIIYFGGFLIGSIYESYKYRDLVSIEIVEKDQHISLLQDSVLPNLSSISEKTLQVTTQLDLLIKRIEMIEDKTEIVNSSMNELLGDKSPLNK